MPVKKNEPRRDASATPIAKLAFAFPALAFGVSAWPAELPTVCVAGGCGPSVTSWLGSGNASAVQQGNTLTVTQQSDRALLNWATFNISADGRVVFQQPSRTSIALNRIYQDSPSRIFGRLEANGEIYLVNPNGLVFGRTAIVNAAGILASTLNISDSTFAAGIASPSLVQNALPALQSDGRVSIIDRDGNPVRGTIDADGNIHQDPAGAAIEVKLVIQQGAKLASGEGGRVLLAAPTIENAGSISAPGGQVIAAAGDKVYLKANSDPALRGFLVEVDAGGKVWNQLTGTIDTPRGNATLVGMAVNQDGRISATTTVNANGSIRLLARDTAVVDPGSDRFTAARTGTLEFGSHSTTTVVPDLADTATAVDDQQQYASRIEGMGHQVTLRSGALLQATGGNIALSALKDPQGPQAGTSDAGSQLRVESGARVDVSGGSATLPMSRNLVTVELRGSELTDSPQQRNGALRGKTVVVDARTGTPLANASGSIATIQRSVAERTSNGGTATLLSDGDIVANPGAEFDVSGGHLDYTAGVVATTKLIGADGKVYDIGSADPNRSYVGIVNPVYRRVDDRWGQIELISAPNSTGVNEAAYTEGRSAGTLQFAAPTMVLQGDFFGSAMPGPYQREPSRMPAGGTLQIGLPTGIGNTPGYLDYRAPSVQFVEHATPVSIAEGAALPSGMTLQLPTDYLDHGFTRTAVNSNGTITLAAGTPLALAAGSSMQLSAQRISVQSDITAAGGSLQFTSRDTVDSQLPGPVQPGVDIGAGVTLDVSGNWTNDALLPESQRPVDPVARDAGSIGITLATQQAGTLQLGDGATLRADGGGHVARSGAIGAGAGGSISLAGNFSSRFIIGNDIGLSAYGVFGARGGTFTLSAPSLTIGNGNRWSIAQDTAQHGGNLRLGTALFSDYGFATVRLTASAPKAGGTPDILDVESGTQLDAVVRSRLLSADAGQRTTGGHVEDFSSLFVPPDYQRAPISISLTAAMASSGASPSSEAGDLRIGAGGQLRGDAGSSFTLASAGSLYIEGVISAQAGTLRAGLTTPPQDRDSGYRADQRLEVASTAVLDVSGTSVLTPNDAGLRQGRVLDAGTISLNSTRGGILVDAGARLDLAGASTTLGLPTQSALQPYRAQQIGSAGGTLELSAPESIGLFGNVDAHAGASSIGQATAGSLRMALTRTSPFNAAQPGSFPSAPREINVGTTDSADHTLVNGRAQISSDFISRSGFDSLQLQADGRINLASGVNLALARRIALDTPELRVTGTGTATLNAPYLALGNSLTELTAPTSSTAGSATLRLNGSFIDIVGSSVLSGIGNAQFNSSGDIRLRGTVRQNGSSIGSLLDSGNMDFTATRVYASTASQFSLTGQAGFSNRIRFNQAGTSPGTPLSAASAITVQAGTIEQNGTLLAPYGTISLNGRDAVSLGAGSVTSVSGRGSVLPYGAVAIGEWYYSALNGNTAGAHAGFTDVPALPTRQINVSADQVSIAADATVDLRGGGDLHAYEWEPGPGGSRDALAPGVTPGLYAILPSTRGQYAPFDPQEYAGSNLTPGASVYLAGGGGLDAGNYPLLPARYALLPGAMLVRAVPGTGGMVPGSVSALKDGTPVLSGYLTFGDTGLGGTQYTGFELRPGSYGRDLASYHDFNASTFFAKDAASGGRTQDAGALSLFAGSQLAAQGQVLTGAASGGLNASIDVSARNLLVSDAMTAAADQVLVSPTLLRSWNPSRLVLGGHIDGDTLDVTADNVTIGVGANLALDETIVAANGNVSVQSGATLATPSASDASRAHLANDAASLQLSGADAGAAVLAVSDLRQVLPTRSGNSSQRGQLDVSAGAHIATGGALTVDAPGGGQLLASSVALNGNTAHVAIGADRVALGQTGGAGVLQVDSALQSALQDAAALRISGNTVEVRNDVSLDLATDRDTRIEILAASLDAAPGADLDLAARNITLAGRDGSTAGTATAGTGTLHAAAREVTVGPGVATLNGFASVDLAATNRVVGAGKGGFTTTGNVAIHGPLVEAGTGADTSVTSSAGAVALTTNGSTNAPAATELGGALTINAQSIHAGTTVAARSGLVSLASNTDLVLDPGARIDVSGMQVTAAGRTASSFGGTVALGAGTALSTSAGSSINASGAGNAAAGQVLMNAGGVAALQGALTASSTDAQSGGSFALDAQSVANMPALLAQLQAGGFTTAQQLHLQNGDIAVASGQQVNARTVELATETGAVTVAGAIDARGADARGSIRLFGGNGVTLQSTGSLVTDATGSGVHGGDIEIGVGASGTIDLAPGSVVSARGASDPGDLILRTPMASGASDLPISRLASTFGPLGRIQLTPVFEVGPTGNTVNAATFTSTVTAAGNFATTNSATILARLANATAPTMALRPEIELRHEGDLSMGALNLGTWRFGGLPGTLSVRTTGTLTLSGLVSDGYSNNAATPVKLDVIAGESSSLRFVAGADLDSIDPTRRTRGAIGDLQLGTNAIVRTGTGNLFLGAARDVKFNIGSAAFTSGNIGSSTLTTVSGYSGSVVFPEHGGNVRVRAGRDVLGSPVTQSASTWQIRGTRPTLTGQFAKTQGIDVSAFRWNLGALGGGDMDVQVGGNVRDLSAAAAASRVASTGQVINYGGGSLSVDARADIASSLFFDDGGVLALRTDGALGTDRLDINGAIPLRSLLELGAASARVQARGDVLLESVVNPTALREANVQGNRESVFFSYGENAGIDLRSAGGSIRLGSGLNATSYFEDAVVGFSTSASPYAFALYPGTVRATSFGADIEMDSGRALNLFPTSRGQLDLFAARDIKANEGGGIDMSDGAASAIPTIGAAQTLDVAYSEVLKVASGARHAGDAIPAQVTAGRDISGIGFTFTKQARVVAGRDIINTNIGGQNLDAADLTLVSAGRDLRYTADINRGGIVLGGPGRLDVIAGRDVDLGFVSSGITTQGRLRNAAIADSNGADVTVMAGVAAGVDYAGFIDKVIAKTSAYDARVIAYIARLDGSTPTAAEALARLRELPPELQRPLVDVVFFAELVGAGRDANTGINDPFKRGYVAIDALFPGSNAQGGGAGNAYAGDLNMSFSRIYTLAGGRISVLVPGGLMNVGLANPPPTVSARPPSELGVVAQGAGDIDIFTAKDVLVNSSRVFTLLGGNIAVWSTLGNIDAGRGAKTSLSSPPPTVLIDDTGNVTLDFKGAVAGSGIRTIATSDNVNPGDVDLVAPAGFVNAGDAGIGSAGRLNIAAQRVIGADNIGAGMGATGVPAEAPGIGASLAGASAAGSSAASSATSSAADNGAGTAEDQQAPLAQAALSWLDVFVLGLGEDNCKLDDVECLKRQER